LGPTEDDITREAIARLVGEEMATDQEVWGELQRLLSRYPGGIPKSNMRQASVIPSAEVMHNRIGTAPGWWVEKDKHIIIALPGPPAEMKLMWEESVLPRMREKGERATILSRTIKTFRLAEARVEELVAPLSRLSNPTLATYIHPDGVYLRITAKAATEEEAHSIISNSEEEVRRALDAHIWGVDNDTLGNVVRRLLKDRNLTLATMESSTDGFLCCAIADCSESSCGFAGGLLAVNHRAKAALGVDGATMERHGEESPEVARAMAGVARKHLCADLGLGVSCAMDSDSNSGDAFICLNREGSSREFSHRLRGDRARMRQRAVFAALFDLRGVLLEEVQCT